MKGIRWLDTDNEQCAWRDSMAKLSSVNVSQGCMLCGQRAKQPTAS